MRHSRQRLLQRGFSPTCRFAIHIHALDPGQDHSHLDDSRSRSRLSSAWSCLYITYHSDSSLGWSCPAKSETNSTRFVPPPSSLNHPIAARSPVHLRLTYQEANPASLPPDIHQATDRHFRDPRPVNDSSSSVHLSLVLPLLTVSCTSSGAKISPRHVHRTRQGGHHQRQPANPVVSRSLQSVLRPPSRLSAFLFLSRCLPCSSKTHQSSFSRQPWLQPPQPSPSK